MKEKQKFELIDGKHQQWGSGTLFDTVEGAMEAADIDRQYNMVLTWYISPPGTFKVDHQLWHGVNTKEHWIIKEVKE